MTRAAVEYIILRSDRANKSRSETVSFPSPFHARFDRPTNFAPAKLRPDGLCFFPVSNTWRLIRPAETETSLSGRVLLHWNRPKTENITRKTRDDRRFYSRVVDTHRTLDLLKTSNSELSDSTSRAKESVLNATLFGVKGQNRFLPKINSF